MNSNPTKMTPAEFYENFNDWFAENPDFRALVANYMQTIPIESFEDLLDCLNHISLLRTTYPVHDLVTTPARLMLRTNQPLLDILLAQSNGWLVYAHQLDTLYQIGTGATKQEARKFRKDYNAKKAPTIREAQQIALLGTTLGHIIEQRMILHCVQFPNPFSVHFLIESLGFWQANNESSQNASTQQV